MKMKAYLLFLILPFFISCNNDEFVSIEAEKITLNHTSIDLKGSNTLQLIATISPSNTIDKEVTWESSDTTIVSVNNKGVVKPINIGSAEITASTNNNKSAICKITVTTSGSWDIKADFGNGMGRHGAVSFSIEGKAYVGLGSDYQYDYDSFGGNPPTSQGGFKDDFWEYNAETDTWRRLNDFPGEKRTEAVSFSINGKGYVGLGKYLAVEPDADGLNSETGFKQDFWEYNPDNDTWTQLPDFPGEGRAKSIGFVINNKGYVGCGGYGKRDFWEFSPSDNSWNQLADYPGESNWGVVGFSIESKGYVGFGYNSEDYLPSTDFWEYSPETNSWYEKQSAKIPTYYDATGTDYYATLYATGFSFNGEGYICLDVNSLWKYNPTSNEWTGLIERFPSVGNNRLKSKTNFVVNGKAFLGLGLNVNICGNHCQTGIPSFSIYQFIP